MPGIESTISGVENLPQVEPHDARLTQGDTVLFALPSADSLYYIDSFDESSDLSGHSSFFLDEPEAASIKKSSSFLSFLSRQSRSPRDDKRQSTPLPPREKDLAQRQASCDTLLFANPAADLCLDNFTDAHAAYDQALAAAASTFQLNDSSLSIGLADNKRQATVQYPFASIWTREIVVSRNSPRESYGMSLRATTEGRVLVTAVDCGSPADEAGVAPGDEVLRVNGFDISGWPARYVARCVSQGEQACQLTLYHDPHLQRLLTIVDFGDGRMPSALRHGDGSDERFHRHMILRVDGDPLGNGDAAAELGIRLRNGRVFEIAPDSPAEAAGLTPGEVIVGIGSRNVAGYCDREIAAQLRRIKGFFSITTMGERDYRDMVNGMHISHAA